MDHHQICLGSANVAGMGNVLAPTLGEPAKAVAPLDDVFGCGGAVVTNASTGIIKAWRLPRLAVLFG